MERGAIAERILEPRERGSFSSMWEQKGTDAGPLVKGGFYRAVLRDSSYWPGLGFAFRAPAKSFRLVRAHFEVDLDHDGVNERFSECASYEGVHLSVWTGEPYQGLERWEMYYYVPYDTEPTCPGLPDNPEDLK
ncbi:MAG TPA: hypothetical protein VJX91_02465 [Candidatus Eisenbacteria bacterium]|nr:hypothetical protein [Candidatus Eisenbacteria bacterium]